MIRRDGTMLGGTEFYYFVATYTCGNGKWKGGFTNKEHTRAPITRPMAAGKIVGIGFSGTGTDKDTRFDLTALVGKPAILGNNAVAGGTLTGRFDPRSTMCATPS
jgi:hypothetical protein